MDNQKVIINRGHVNKWIKKYVMNPFYIKLFFVITTFILMIPPFKTAIDGFVKVGVVWGGIYLLYDLFTKRWFLKTRYIIWLIIFLGLYFVSNLVNYETYLYNNTVVFGYTFLVFLVLYPVPADLDRHTVFGEIRLYCVIFIMMSFAASVVSMLVYFLNFNQEVMYHGNTYWIGVHNGRFWGIYNNPNLAAVMAVISVMLSVVYLLLRQGKRALPRWFLVTNIIVHVLIVMFTNSRGGELLLCGTFAITAFFWRDRIAKKLFKKSSSTVLKSLAVFALTLVVGIGGYFLLQKPAKIIASEVPRFTVFLQHKIQGDSEKPNYDDLIEDLDRPENASGDVTTGRIVIWKYALQKFQTNPIFGVTSEGLNKEVLVDNRPSYHVHNLYLQIMASTGIISLIIFLIFKLSIAVKAIRYLFTSRERDIRYDLVGILGAFAATMMFHQMVEVFEMFQVILVAMVMWTLLGYMVYFLPKNTGKLVRKQHENRESN